MMVALHWGCYFGVGAGKFVYRILDTDIRISDWEAGSVCVLVNGETYTGSR